ncbi:CLUMA_CG015460, isoform A [Clunio marinus]|uniref:CLUMA_CG015460, isoform A n=1 Tax=Clunio marinus TaxID=568069 RepID=A0A1J1IT38_9DIPT|nr:CLUMA_CG015460, isoform A [Clunio marinus]
MLPEYVDLYYPYKDHRARCLLELRMLNMSQQIRSKPDWHKKMLKSEITSKWRKEAEAQELKVDAIDYVLEEVKYYATLKDGSIEPGPVDGSWQADNLVDETLSREFKKLVSKTLENIPEEEIDYHPGSDQQVIDLVHPSLYCYVEDMSILINKDYIDPSVLPSIENPTKKVRTRRYLARNPDEGKYRWMPADISIKNDTVSFDSYINNLHPIKNKKLYDLIGKIFIRFLPMFNRSLTDIANPRGIRIDIQDWSWYTEEEFDGDDESDKEEEYEEWINNRTILPVPVPKFEVPKAPEKIFDLKGEDLQIIVKLSYIKLTPEKPKYPGGSWHVEGIDEERIVATGIYYYEIFIRFLPMFNRSLTDIANPRGIIIDVKQGSWYNQEEEFDYGDDESEKEEEYQEWINNQKPKYPGGSWHVEGIDEEKIVATGIYYYEVDNITESKLSFRVSIEEPIYEQNDDRGVEVIYGLKSDDPLNQVVGHMITKQDRCVVFPNIYQHIVTPFELVDKTKPGYRKILVFFLVNPYLNVVSTYNVLPQQPGWDDVESDAPKNKRRTFTKKQAEENREKLMFERKYTRDEYQKDYYEREFSLCEH